MSARGRVLAVAALTVALAIPASPAAASTSLRFHEWSSAGIVLAQGQSSNTVGFWQNLVKSWHPAICVDGIFGSQTWVHTHGFQTNVAQVPADGVVGPVTWNGTQNATDAAGFPRLQPHSGPEDWTYYGGSAMTSHLVKRVWGGVYQWGFRKPQSSTGTMHSSQTTVRTVGGC